MNKLGCHVQSWGNHLDWVIQSKPPAIKVLENTRYPLERYKAEVGGLVVGRLHRGEVNGDRQSPQVWADAIAGYFDPVKQFIDCVVTLNEDEDIGQDWDVISRRAEFEVKCCEILHSRGYRVAVGSFSVGNPPRDGDALKENWRRFLPASQVADALSLHEYSAPRMWTNETWHCLRYRRVASILAELGAKCPPIIVGETGIDWGVFEGAQYSKKGWRGGGDVLPISPADYVRDLDWYAKQIEQDPVVLAAFIFNIGNPDWWSFEIGGVAEIGDYIRTNTTGPAVWPVGASHTPLPAPAPERSAMVIGAGLRKAESVVGPYLESETYHWPGTDREVSLAVGQNGYACWSRKTNETIAYTNDGQIYRDGGNVGTGKWTLVSDKP